MISLRYPVIIWAVIVLVACTEPATPAEKQALFNKTLEERIRTLKKNKVRDCYLTAVSEAEAFVDSTLHLELDLDLLDTIEMIDRPYRPERPDYIRDADTSKVKPLFDQRDSLFLTDPIMSKQ